MLNKVLGWLFLWGLGDGEYRCRVVVLGICWLVFGWVNDKCFCFIGIVFFIYLVEIFG